MVLTPHDSARIAELRQRQLDGTITLEDLREVIRTLREGRIGAQAASTASRTRAAKVAVPDADKLLDQLMGGL